MWPTVLKALGVAVLLTVVMSVLTDCTVIAPEEFAENDLVASQISSQDVDEDDAANRLTTISRTEINDDPTKSRLNETLTLLDLGAENVSSTQDVLSRPLSEAKVLADLYPGKKTIHPKSEDDTNGTDILENREQNGEVGATTHDGTSTTDDARTVGFQLPLPNDKGYEAPENALETDSRKNSTGPRNFPDDSFGRNEPMIKNSNRDHPKTGINHLGPKSTKSFYEIKSLVTTETVDTGEAQEAGTLGSYRKFIRPTIPWMPSARGKYGPYFEDGPEDENITARIGSTVLLDCKIGMLHDKTVTWLQHSKDSIHLLTVGRQLYSADQRVSLSFRYPSNWRLQIAYASPRDSGLYECQVATHPPRVKKIHLVVTAPVLTIVDDAGRIVAGERHLKAGSVLKLSCEVRDVRPKRGESVVWTKGDETLLDEVRQNITIGSVDGEEVQVVVSTISVERATPRDAGNYSCLVPGRTRKTVSVHVLNGELPAAVHDGSGVSRAVLNFWLVHLTISYVFSR